MARRKQVSTPNRHYLDYYLSQAGHGIPKFQGTQTQYGYGLGSILRSIIRSIIPIGRRVASAVKPVARQAFEIAKPHMKNAAKDLTSAAVRHVVSKMGDRQTGRGKRKRKRVKRTKPKPTKKRRAVPRVSTKIRRKTRNIALPDIF